MTFEGRLAVLSATLVGLCSCGQGVHDLTVSSQPLVVIKGHVDASSLIRTHPSSALLGALIWASVPQVNPVCVEFQDAVTAPACPDPLGVFTGEIQASVAVDGDGNFELPLFHLPAARVSVGDAVTRIAYGTLVVVEDVNGDGQLTFVLPSGGRRRRALPPVSNPSDPDLIVAATFSSLRVDQRRIVFREGGFVRDSYFYPAPGCDDPPEGLSVMMAGAYVDASHAMGPCAYATTEGRLELTPLSPTDGLALECRAVQAQPNVQQPVGDEPPSGNPTKTCFGANVLATVYSGPCPYLRSYALAGCQEDPMCASPEWNLTLAPPSWWSCP
jgi:hypothetical protein